MALYCAFLAGTQLMITPFTSDDARDVLRDGLWAGVIAGTISGAPSTLWALASGDDPLEASTAAGTLLLPQQRGTLPLLASAAVFHAGLSLGWAVALAALLPRRSTWAWSMAAGLGIAALDLGIGRRRRPRIARLPVVPQVADHLAYGCVVGMVVDLRRRRRA